MGTPGTSKQTVFASSCEICSKNEGKYTCPRCNMSICSLECYKGPSHGQCSEQFYKKCVEDELRLGGVDAGAKKKMEEILMKAQKLYNNEDDEALDSDDSADDGADDLTSRLQGIDLDDSDALWEALTDKERAEYVNLLSSTKITKILPEWHPWWIDGNNCPPLMSDIPMITTLTKIPSPLLPFLVMNALMAYQISLRIIRGQSDILSVEASTMISQLSPPLRGINSTCSSFDEAAALIVSEFGKHSWGVEFPVTFETVTSDLRDLTVVSSCNVLLALSHMKNIFDDAIEIIPATKKNQMQRFTGDAPKVADLKKTSKKIIFYVSWAKQMDDSEWDRLVGNTEFIVDD